MRIRLVFHTWLDKEGEDIYHSPEMSDSDLSMGDFHAGITFDAKIDLSLDAADDLRAALDEGYKPMFYAMPVDPDS